MKKLILTLALSVACVAAFAQGTLNFANVGTGGLNAPVTEVGTGVKLAGTAWIAQLWYGPAGTTDAGLLVAHPTTATFSTIAAQAGYFTGGARTIDTIAGGTAAVLQVRVWNAAAGATWAAANANAAVGIVGASSLFTVTLAASPTSRIVAMSFCEPRSW